MKASELRIGNLLQSKPLSIPRLEISSDGVMTVTGYGISVIESDIDNKLGIEPILLTEEWLLRFGFEKYDWVNGYFIKCNGKYLFIQFYEPDNTTQILVFFTKITQDRRGHLMHGRDYFIPKNSKQYVHQLQNLYFALTGKELEVEP